MKKGAPSRPGRPYSAPTALSRAMGARASCSACARLASRADAARCALVKQYAQLGLWILSTPAQLETARKLGADVIETPGQLKPERDGRKTD